MSQTFDPTRHLRPARTGPPTGAKVVIAVCLIGIAAATGWMVATSFRPSTKEGPAPSPKPNVSAPERWTFLSLSAARLCKRDGQLVVQRMLLRPTKKSAVPARLSDHMPLSSPVGDFQLATDGPVEDFIRPWDEALSGHGVREGYARGFNSHIHAGGFAVYAYRYPGRANDLAAAGDAFHSLVCDFGGEPVAVAQQPGVVAGIRAGESTVGWWVHGSRLIQVSYAMYGHYDEDVADALTVLRTVWHIGEPEDIPTITA